MTPHRVLFLGAGYAGLPAAKRFARQVHADEVAVTIVSMSDRFVERPRLHQLATGQPLRDLRLQPFLDGTDVILRVARVTAIDLANRTVHLDGANGGGAHTEPYDTLVYALGSTIEVDQTPGVRQHALALTAPKDSARTLSQLREVAGNHGTVVVCGGGLTGIEAATEVAESFPGARVRLVTAGQPGGWLSPAAQRYLVRTLDQLGVAVTPSAHVDEVLEGHLRLTAGESIEFDACIWTGGFAVPRLAPNAGLEVDDVGRIVTDQTLRSVSHPQVYAIGDAAAVPGPWGDSLAMGCRTGGFMAPALADVVAARLAGREPPLFRYRYFHECISLGRRRGLVQFLNADESPRPFVLTGRTALAYKDVTLNSAVALFKHPGPYLPRRRHRIRTATTPHHPSPAA